MPPRQTLTAAIRAADSYAVAPERTEKEERLAAPFVTEGAREGHKEEAQHCVCHKRRARCPLHVTVCTGDALVRPLFERDVATCDRPAELAAGKVVRRDGLDVRNHNRHRGRGRKEDGKEHPYAVACDGTREVAHGCAGASGLTKRAVSTAAARRLMVPRCVSTPARSAADTAALSFAFGHCRTKASNARVTAKVLVRLTGGGEGACVCTTCVQEALPRANASIGTKYQYVICRKLG